MKTTILHTSSDGHGSVGCAGGNCPTIYETDRGTVLFQGYVLTAEEKAAFNIPSNEDVIEVPKAFIDSFVSKMKL